MLKWYELWSQNTLFLSEHAAVYLISVTILFANATNNWVPAWQWCHSYAILFYK